MRAARCPSPHQRAEARRRPIGHARPPGQRSWPSAIGRSRSRPQPSVGVRKGSPPPWTVTHRHAFSQDRHVDSYRPRADVGRKSPFGTKRLVRERLVPHLPEAARPICAVCRSWHLPSTTAAAGGCRGFAGPVPPPLVMSFAAVYHERKRRVNEEPQWPVAGGRWPVTGCTSGPCHATHGGRTSAQSWPLATHHSPLPCRLWSPVLESAPLR